MTEKEKERTCENCLDEPTTILCPECPKCYCDGCSEFTHRKGPKKDHKTERIPEGVGVKATCPLHNGNPLKMLCLDEVKLCCPMCVGENLHKGHKAVKIDDIKQDNETFSAAEVRKDFEDTLKRSTTLDRKIDEIIEDINKEMEETKEKIEIFFDEEHQKLEEEKTRLINELDDAYNKATERLNEFKAIIEDARKYSTVLSKAANALKLNDSDNDYKCSRLMELNIMSKMEEQKRKIERLLGTEMRDLKIYWDRKARKLSFARNLFNGAPNVMNVAVKAGSWGEMDVSWEIDGNEKSEDDVRYTVEMRKEGEKDWKEAKSGLTDKKCKVRGLMGNSAYEVRVRCVAEGGSLVGEWGDVVKGRTLKAPEFSECVWKKCPDYVDDDRKYSIYKKNPRVATNIGNDYMYCTIIGSTHIPLNKATSWSIKILKSRDNNGHDIFIGIAPSDINQNADCNYNKCGWYFYCCSSLWSGPPHNYSYKKYGPRKGDGQYVHTGDNVGVVMDTIKGELSFVLDGVNLGVAYEGIPLDKPLVPCVLLYHPSDSVELDTSGVKEIAVDSSIPALSNITTKSSTWNSIILTWDEVADASFYQVEVDGSKSWYVSITNSFTKRGLLPETEHSFRVRTVKGSLVSEWSGVVKGRTSKVTFETSWWKECPDDVDKERKYSVDETNPRTATRIFFDGHNQRRYYSTTIGNTPIPLDTVTSWSIKILKSWDNDGGIYIGVAPSDIDQNDDDNYIQCGWYFNCHNSALCSGPPHKYRGKAYGPRKEIGECVHTGDSVGVAMDTTKGELSFVLNGVNYGVAYEGIPLDKPLVPCVIINIREDSVELDTSEVKETAVDSSISVPPNITTKIITWDSITLTWDKDEDASFYQIEVDGSKSWDASTINSFTKRNFLQETEHSFRVRTVRGSSVSEWSDVVKERTLKAYEFSECVWKECPDYVYESNKYIVDEKNPRVVTKTGDDRYCNNYSIIVGNTYILPNAVTSWNIKILGPENNNGNGILIGIAPFDINQNSINCNKCGWYFYCYGSVLSSGPPHNYNNSGKKYGPRKGDGQYVHTGDSVGVVMDTTKGELSFALNGVNLGVAYEGIPLDKPLVPCVLLWCQDDSVELDISEVKENVVSSISVPSNITEKSITWNSITLTWDKVADASFYQIEVDGSKSWDATTTNSFTKRGLLPCTEHSFRVRTVRGSSVSEWSGVVEGKTSKVTFETSWWKERHDVIENRKYSVYGENLRIATKANYDGWCTIIGNTYIPHNAVTSWSIKILKSRKGNGSDIHAGVAPFDINQDYYDCYDNFNKYGWYFNCFNSRLRSGPPHNYNGKEYGPRKEGGQYVHTGDNVGVVVDTTKGELSFVLNGVNLGLAYEGIPLDKPLIPCVLLYNDSDSVELDTSEVKENEVDSSIPIPSNITTKSTTWDSITLTWDEVTDASFYQIEVDGSKSWDAFTTSSFTKRGFFPNTEHSFRVRTVRGSSVSVWSSIGKGKTLKVLEFNGCMWKKCPDDVDEKKKYSVDGGNPKVAAKINNNSYCTIIGNTIILPNKVTLWNIKILKSKNNNGGEIYIGVAPFDINQNDVNYDKCGWYFNCYESVLCSGPPHKYDGKKYGPRKEKYRRYVHTGDSVGVVMDTTKGELSFVLNGVNLGVAYGRIPLDKPLVPCVLLYHPSDSVELDTSGVKENVDNSIPVPFKITTKSITWDSITLTWDKVEDASFYQIEVDGSKSWGASTTNIFTKSGLLPHTEHSFRVRTVRGSSVSEWSDVVKRRTLKWECVWKECHDDVDEEMKYSVDGGNPRVATKVNGDDNGCFPKYCTIIGNTYIPLNTISSWSIKVLKSRNNGGGGIYIGIAPFNINQNANFNYNEYGWYFDCYSSRLWSGPPHNYDDKEYGPRKEKDGQYVHTGDSVGVVMDTTKGELSFVLNGVNLGVAYEGIPLDKPLVPCVLLYNEGDSVKLDTSEVKENVVDSSIPAPSNITAKSITWDSIILTWNKVEDASFYQIEADGSKSWGASTTNKLTCRGFLPETEHSFRVRAVRESSVSEWSGVAKGKTSKESFETSGWKECPDDVYEWNKYIVNGENPRVATKINEGMLGSWCTIIGNTPIPLDTVTSWSIKILKSKNNNGQYINIGITPFDINQNYVNNIYGWYFYCYDSTLYSGPPHSYSAKEYGPRKENGQYVHTRNSVGVAMDTTKGELSFVLDEVNLGVAYCGILLDKPLVPCVILHCQGDSVELVI